MSQGNYGHKARKQTWLYLVGNPKELDWSIPKGMVRLDEGRRKLARNHPDFRARKRISTKEMVDTPEEFKELLIELVNL